MKSSLKVLFFLVLICSSYSINAKNIVNKKPPFTAKDALEGFLKSNDKYSRYKILAMLSFFSDRKPFQWKILVTNSNFISGNNISSIIKKGIYSVINKRKLREVTMSQGIVVKFMDIDLKHLSPNSDEYPEIPFTPMQMRVDSYQAYDIAKKNANYHNIKFYFVHYQIRCRDKNSEPVWLITLLDKNNTQIGYYYISAINGNILQKNFTG